jgi:dTDP-4-amino-4,6-dideoxygalactose transaminase
MLELRSQRRDDGAMQVPFVDLVDQHKALRREILDAIGSLLDRCDFILGGAVSQFEKEFAAYQRCRHAVGVACGLDAMTMALKASGVGVGDEVVLPANTFAGTAFAICAAGARPVLADVEPYGFNLDPEGAAAVITSRTRAITPVHLFGQIADMDAIAALAQRRDLVLIEDAAQAHGAELHGERAGRWGRVACFSFYPSKNLGACGDAGAIVTNDAGLADQVALLRNYGSRRKNEHLVIGMNSRLDTLQAAILSIKLKRLDAWIDARNRVAAAYIDRLAAISIALPRPLPSRRHTYHLFVIRVENADGLRSYLQARGVGTSVHYPTPIHKLPAFAWLGYRDGDFPVTEELARTMISLPLYPELSESQIDYVCERIRDGLRSGVGRPVAIA